MQEVIGPYFEKHSFKILKHDMKLPVKKKKNHHQQDFRSKGHNLLYNHEHYLLPITIITRCTGQFEDLGTFSDLPSFTEMTSFVNMGTMKKKIMFLTS